MACIYRYIDNKDNIIKYVGIVWAENRTLSQRLREHAINDRWCAIRDYRVEYIEENINTRTDAEYFEAHYIALFRTGDYYNKSKSGWGVSTFLPVRTDWKIFSSGDINEWAKNNKLVRDTNKKAKNKKVKNKVAKNKVVSNNKNTYTKTTRYNSKPVEQLDKDKKILFTYKSIKEASEKSKISQDMIRKCAKSNMEKIVLIEEYNTLWKDYNMGDYFRNGKREFYYFRYL